MKNIMLEQLKNIVGTEYVRVSEPMGIHTTFRAGGKAAYFVEPATVQKLEEIIKFLNERQGPYFILGNGSNVLVKDSGYQGVIIKTGNYFGDIEIKPGEDGKCIVEAGAGAMLSKTAKVAAKNGLTGMETLAGIPGTVGGAVAMNAGAYGGEIKDVIVYAQVMNEQGDIMTLQKEELDLSYRHSIVSDKNYVVLKAGFELVKGIQEEINSKMAECAKARKEKQPLEYPSAGSTFKRPEGYFAGKLIMDAGLKGYRVGDAMVSEKHCGFVINTGKATATDILKVIEDVKAEVFRQFGVELEPEVKILG